MKNSRQALARPPHIPAAATFADPHAIIRRARAATAVNPGDDDALRALSLALYQIGSDAEADAAAQAAIMATLKLPIIATAIRHLTDGDMREAERLARQRLAARPDDAVALIIMGDLTYRLGIYDHSEDFLRRALVTAPAFEDALLKLGDVLHASGKTSEAMQVFAHFLADHPDHVATLHTMIRISGEIGDYERTIEFHERLLALIKDQPESWVSYGNTLKTVGRFADAVMAYRHAIAIDPTRTESWWALSNMKAGQLNADDVLCMEELVAGTESGQQKMYLHFALGKALEDNGSYDRSFFHYAAGNRERLALRPHDSAEITEKVDQTIAFFTSTFFERTAGFGDQSPDPIFIVSLPRSGSTLLEQILSSHSAIEGTSELPHIPSMVRRLLADRWEDPKARYPDLLDLLDRKAAAELGRKYLAEAAKHRKTDRPYFIDKLPTNWLHIGLIQLMLPNATIIDARREPMACCFANFKQHFARGQTFAYSLSDVGEYYRLYVRTMAHFDDVLPGRVIRMQHEDLLDDPEAQVRRLMTAIGVPFEENCLRFYENARPVRTPSSEQVRRPINRDAVDLWRHYEPWLDELKQALGPLAPR